MIHYFHHSWTLSCWQLSAVTVKLYFIYIKNPISKNIRVWSYFNPLSVRKSNTSWFVHGHKVVVVVLHVRNVLSTGRDKLSAIKTFFFNWISNSFAVLSGNLSRLSKLYIVFFQHFILAPRRQNFFAAATMLLDCYILYSLSGPWNYFGYSKYSISWWWWWSHN